MEDMRSICKREFFISAQKKVYEAGKNGAAFGVAFGEVVLANRENRSYITPGVQKCLNDEWKRGRGEVSQTPVV